MSKQIRFFFNAVLLVFKDISLYPEVSSPPPLRTQGAGSTSATNGKKSSCLDAPLHILMAKNKYFNMYSETVNISFGKVLISASK